MKCPICSSKISAWAVISASPQRNGPPSVTCGSCGSILKIKGIYIAVVAPLILLTFFPYRMLPNNQIYETLILAAVASLLYWLSFLLFIKLEGPREIDKDSSRLIQKQ